jgi:8-oxo-dGTP pyrophosphatase MutT (NUDIX family)
VREELVARLRAALALEIPYPERPPLQQGRRAGVQVLFSLGADGQPWLLLTRRTDTVETHKGQIAFPGGAFEQVDRDEVDTALRETEEEMGIPREDVEVVGKQPPLWTVTDFWVTPIVTVHRRPLEEITLHVNPREIDVAFWVNLTQLQDPAVYAREYRQWNELRYPIHAYQIGEHRIWGATGAMVKNLLDRLAALG